MAGNRTRINCLEGNYAHHYTTIATAQPVSTKQQTFLLAVSFKIERQVAQRNLATSRAYYTNVSSPWPSSLLPRLHYKVQPSCILRLFAPPLRDALPVPVRGGIKRIFFLFHPSFVVYPVFLKARRKALATARKIVLSHCKLTR